MFSLIDSLIKQYGLAGVALLMLLENLVPVIPSELILPLAGFEAARGGLNPILAVLAGTLGSVLGGVAWYAVGRRFGLARALVWSERGGRWLTLTPEHISKGYVWFKRWGALAVFAGRTLPGVRSFICIPAGIARQPLALFLLSSSLGALSWSALLVLSGYLLQANYQAVRQWLDPVADGFFAVCILIYIVRLIGHRRTPGS